MSIFPLSSHLIYVPFLGEGDCPWAAWRRIGRNCQLMRKKMVSCVFSLSYLVFWNVGVLCMVLRVCWMCPSSLWCCPGSSFPCLVLSTPPPLPRLRTDAKTCISPPNSILCSLWPSWPMHTHQWEDRCTRKGGSVRRVDWTGAWTTPKQHTHTL